jgi:hypothetical protein
MVSDPSGPAGRAIAKIAARRAAPCLLLLAALSGCGPARLLLAPPGWPRHVDGRLLYATPRSFIYATSPAAAGWMDRYLNDRIPRIEKRFGETLGRGMVIAVSPGDKPIPGVDPWPSYEEVLALAAFGRVDVAALGLPPPSDSTYRWACVLATEAFDNEAVTEQFRRTDRRFWSQPHALLKFLQAAPGFLFGRPYIRQGHLATCDAQREQSLAATAIQAAALRPQEKAALLHRVYEFYGKRGAQKQVPDIFQ